MHSDRQWLILLERQATEIQSLSAAVNHMRRRGIPHEFALRALSDDMKAHRRALGECPLHVLAEYVDTPVGDRQGQGLVI